MVGTGRFELPTCRLGGGRSIHLSYVPTCQYNFHFSLPALESFLTDVVAEVHSVEVDFFDGCVGSGLRGF